MRFPNQRYGDPEHLKYYTYGWSIKQIARHLKRDEKTIGRWLRGQQKMPWWVPELFRLERIEKYHELRQMGIDRPLGRLGIIRDNVLEFPDIEAIRARQEQKSVVEQLNDLLIQRYKM